MKTMDFIPFAEGDENPGASRLGLFAHY